MERREPFKQANPRSRCRPGSRSRVPAAPSLLGGGPGDSGQPPLPRRVAGAVGDSLAGGLRVSCDSAAGPLPPAAAGPFPERPGGGGRRGATISARARGCRPKAGQDRRAGGGGGARGSSRSGLVELLRRLAGSCGSAPSRAWPAMRAALEPRPPSARAEVGLPGRRASGPQLRGPRSAPDSPIAGSVATCLWRSQPRGSGARGRSRPPPSRR